MSKFLSLLALSVMVLSTSAIAADAAKKPTKEACAKAADDAARAELGCPAEASK